MIAVTRLKRCSSCQRSQTKDNFSHDRRTKDGLQSQCKQCRADSRRRRYKPAKRTCLRCRRRKRPTEFHRHSGREDGLTQLCKACFAEVTGVSHVNGIKQAA